MNSLDLIKLQISLEYQLDAQGCLVPFPGSGEQAWYIVYRYTGGYVPYLNHTLPLVVSQALLELGPAKAFDRPGEVVNLISQLHQTCRGGEDIFWSGYFPHPPEQDGSPVVTMEGEACVVRVGEKVVCKAVSIRQNECCAEVYVETAPEYRRQGFGKQAVAAWAIQVNEWGLVAFYSYRKTNLPSANLARKLGVVWYADAVAFEPE